MIIRKAVPNDAEALLKIYAPYVKDTAVTFEYDVPTIGEFKNRIANITKKYPYLVAIRDNKIVGYTYANTFKDRAAYDYAVETTVYVDKSCKKSGIGKALYLELEKALAAKNIINLYACIAYPENDDEYLTKNSVQFHEHLGYKLVGRFHKCGYKFGRWYDMVWMEKFLSAHPHTDKI
mgnify:CR=1 FL=1